MSDTLIKVEGVSKKFCRNLKRSLWYGMQDLGNELIGKRHGGNGELRQDEFWALRDVNFEIKRGEAVGIIGRNGTGKTTLLRMLSGLIKPDQGRIEMHGRVGGLIALGAGFNPILTGRENIYVNASVLGLSKREIDVKINSIIDFSEIRDFIDTPVQNYSSGMTVRLGFAIATALNPDILLLDEVLAVGDEAFQGKCFDRLADYLNGRDKTLFLVSHNLRQVERVCTWVIWLERGRVVHQGPASDICSAYQRSVHAQTLEASATESPLPNVANSGELTVTRIRLLKDTGDKPINDVEVHTAIRVAVDFHCHTALTAPDIVIGFHTSDSVFIAAASTAGLSPRPSFHPGDNHIECRFPDIPLLPGVYYLRLGFLDRHLRAIWVAHKLCAFQVVAPQGLNPLNTPPGLVDIASEWTLPSGGAGE